MESLYVCLFSNGHIKVGRSIDPRSRIAQHEERVACVGVLLCDFATFACSNDLARREAVLIDRCVEAAASRHQYEWFAGLDFATVREWARELAASDLHPRGAQLLALGEAIDRSNGQAQLAARIGTKQSTVAMWLARGRVKADFCPAIERETGVLCERLRPDIPWSVLRGTDSAPTVKQDGSSSGCGTSGPPA